MKLVIKESYENMFGETLYKFIIGNGTYSPDIYYAYGYNEQEALDTVIDNLEKKNSSDIYTIDEIENSDFYEDEYIIGGNHGVALVHYGEFRIETPDDYKEATKAGILKPLDESLKEYADNTYSAELFRGAMNIVEDNYGRDFKTGLENVTENLIEEFERYANDEASDFLIDEIDGDTERYLEEFENFILFSLRENDINEYDY